MEITMDSNISIEMTLTKAHLLARTLRLAALDVKEIDLLESERLRTFSDMIYKQIDKYFEEQFDEYLK